MIYKNVIYQTGVVHGCIYSSHIDYDGFGEDLKSFEIRMNKEYQSERLKDAETYQFPLPIIPIETRCEPVIKKKPETQETGVST